MKPEKFIGILLVTLLLSCEKEEQSDQKIGEVIFESNHDILNSTFDVDVYINGEKIGSLMNTSDNSNSTVITKEKLKQKLGIGVHEYEVKVYSYNGEAGKSIKGNFIVKENKTSEVFIDFKEYNSWI